MHRNIAQLLFYFIQSFNFLAETIGNDLIQYQKRQSIFLNVFNYKLLFSIQCSASNVVLHQEI
jgi:hypothetical protein